MRLRFDDVSVDLGGVPIVRGASLDVPQGTVMGLVGPNGSGKSTLLRTAYRVLRPRAGAVWLDLDEAWALPPREVARRIAVVVQEPAHAFDFSVREMVEMGRTPHKGVLQRDRSEDAALVEAALRRVGTWELRERRFTTLSGGEKQRTLIARALAQEGRVLLLDEPTNHLDVRYQLELLSLVRDLGTTCLLALHDLNQAAAWCDLVAVVDRGRIEAAGAPDAVLTPERIARVFRVLATPYRHPVTGTHQLALVPDPDAIERGRSTTGAAPDGLR